MEFDIVESVGKLVVAYGGIVVAFKCSVYSDRNRSGGSLTGLRIVDSAGVSSGLRWGGNGVVDVGVAEARGGRPCWVLPPWQMEEGAALAEAVKALPSICTVTSSVLEQPPCGLVTVRM